MIVKWKTELGYAEIVRQECNRETEKSVWFIKSQWFIGPQEPPKEYKANKIGERIGYHDTFESAKAWLLMDASEKLRVARRHLEVCNSYYGNVKGLKEPVEQEEKYVFSK